MYKHVSKFDSLETCVYTVWLTFCTTISLCMLTLLRCYLWPTCIIDLLVFLICQLHFHYICAKKYVSDVIVVWKVGSMCLTFNLLNFFNRIIHIPFLELSIIILRVSRWKLEVGQPRGRAGWPGSILMAKANHFRFQ